MGSIRTNYMSAKSPNFFFKVGEQGWLQWWEHSPPNQCGPGSNPGIDVIRQFSLLLVLNPCFERFFSMYSDFPLSSKINIIIQISIPPGIKLTKNHYVDVLP